MHHPYFVLSVLFILGSVSLNGQWINWLVQKKKAGVLLLSMKGMTATGKRIAWGVWWFVVTLQGFNTFYHLKRLGRNPTETEILNPEFFYWTNFFQWALLIFWWSFVIIFLVALASPEVEIRENGIYGALTVIEWRRIKSYQWDASDPNRLLIRVKRRPFTFPPGQLNIPASYREEVDRILEEYVPDKRVT